MLLTEHRRRELQLIVVQLKKYMATREIKENKKKEKQRDRKKKKKKRKITHTNKLDWFCCGCFVYN